MCIRIQQHSISTFSLLSLILFHALGITAAPALRWESGPAHRRLALTVPSHGQPGFTLQPSSSTGIQWTNRLAPERYMMRQNLMNGSGVALGDYDADGWCDIYFCNKDGPNALYRNLGNWRFEEVTEQAGVACAHLISSGAVFADINGDGRLDLLVTSFLGPNACFLNEGQGRFSEVTGPAGLVSKGGTTSMALADLDGDRDLDLYVNYFGIEAILRDGGDYSVRMVAGKPRVMGRYAKRLAIEEGRLIEFGEPDILYLNDGQGRFAPRDWKEAFRDENNRPMEPPWDFGLAVQMRDINLDGAPDIYVCNDFQTPDRLWLNDGRGSFRAIDALALRNMSYASMGADFADIDRDGHLDFVAVEMLSRDLRHHLQQSSPMTPLPRAAGAIRNREEVARNTLCWNRGDGTYAEIAWFGGLAASDWSWTPVFVDVDLDGYEDLLITNGHLHDVNNRDVNENRPADPGLRQQAARALLLSYPPIDAPNAAYRNTGRLQFEDRAEAWGFNSRQISHGMALGDLDNDGDLDAVVNCVNAPPLVYRNNSPAPRVAARLKGLPGNTQGVGARITLHGGPVPAQQQEILAGGRYLSHDDTVRVFAAGDREAELRLEVIWRSGRRSVLTGVQPNTLYELDEAGATEMEPKPAVSFLAIFEDVSARLGHFHFEEAFDDFLLQPLLPKKLSQLGPGLVWFDFNGDHYDDLAIGAGKGSPLSVFQNNGQGGFTPMTDPVLASARLPCDSAGLAAFASAGITTLLAGLSSYGELDGSIPAARRVEFAGAAVRDASPLPGIGSSTGPLALADIDADGDLDLFVGGRVISGKYPEPASSRVFLNESGQFVLDPESSRLLDQAGLVSGALFSDLDGDGWVELILACEWGPIRVFQNHQGKFREVTEPWGFGAHTGWWNGVATGDFDGDGRLDLVAGNWGLNSSYQRSSQGPWHVYYGDFNSDGRTHLLEAALEPASQKLIPWRDLTVIEQSLPWVRERVKRHEIYTGSSVREILGERADAARALQAATLASTIFFNRGGRFEARPLPDQAQWSPAQSVHAADLDGDGHEDLFLSQNFFAVRPEMERQDAGRALWLKGDGQGGLIPVSGQASGLLVYGEQRGAALSDFDRDGRVDLAVTQNGGATLLFRNRGAQPGLRIRLAGPPANPNGVGAAVRLIFGERLGPVREIHAGSGYWSQDSMVVVLGTPEPPSQVWVRWPGGETTRSDIPVGAREIEVPKTGPVRSIL